MARLLRLKRLIFTEMNGVEYIEDVEGGIFFIASLAFQKSVYTHSTDGVAYLLTAHYS
jgi:hypothetical protein